MILTDVLTVRKISQWNCQSTSLILILLFVCFKMPPILKWRVLILKSYTHYIYSITFMNHDYELWNPTVIPWKLLSGPMILLKVVLKLRIMLQNIWMRVVGNILDNCFPSNLFLCILFPARFHANCQAVLAAVSIIKLNLVYFMNLT